jgi:hypothetical protein
MDDTLSEELPEKGEKTAEDIKQDIEISKTKRKIDIAIVISILALLTSIAQLIITSPFFIDIYNKPDILVKEGENMTTGTPIVSSSYQIINNSNKTATNLVLGIDVYDLNSIHIYPENSFKLADSIDGTYFFKKRYYFFKSNLIPNETVSVFMHNHIDTIRTKIGADTLRTFWEYNCQHLVPHIEELKSDLGYAKINRHEKFIIYSYELKLQGRYKLEGKPIRE